VTRDFSSLSQEIGNSHEQKGSKFVMGYLNVAVERTSWGAFSADLKGIYFSFLLYVPSLTGYICVVR
jgi:hypothetical protein